MLELGCSEAVSEVLPEEVPLTCGEPDAYWLPEELGWAELERESRPEDVSLCSGVADGMPEGLGSSETVSEELPEEVPLSCAVADAYGLPESLL